MPFGHWNAITFVGALRHDGIIAPWVINGSINLGRAAARSHPQARRHRGHGQSRQPKGPAIRQAIRAAGAKIFFLPAYSPDLNPIEQVIAKLKHLLRKAAERTKETVWRRIGSLLDTFTAQKCEN
jgi:hypothetical protein